MIKILRPLPKLLLEASNLSALRVRDGLLWCHLRPPLDGADSRSILRGFVRRKGKGRGRSASDPTVVLVSANLFWNIANFRAGLIEALVDFHDQVIVAAPAVDQAWLAAKGAKGIDIAIDRSGLNPFKDLALLFNYLQIIRSVQARVFLSYTAKPNIYGSFAARLCGVKALPNVSGLGTAFINPGPLSALVGGLYRIAFAKCPLVFFQNQDDSDLFVRRKIVRSDQVRLLPGSGVDLDRFRPAPVDNSAEVRFLFIGRLLGDKGVREFAEAARLLRLDYPSWTFQLLGPIDEGNRSGIGQAELNRWSEDRAVEYLGQADDVRPYIEASTAVVLPSYREGLPRSLLEAAAMARPLIATDVPGNRRVVKHGVNGLLCEARNPNSLAQAMQDVGLMDAGKRAAMGSSGRELVEQSFGERRVVEAYLDAIAQLRAGRRS